MSGVEHPHYAVSLIILIVVLRSWTQLGLSTFIPFLYQAKLSSDPAYVATLLFFFLGSGTVGTVIGGRWRTGSGTAGSSSSPSPCRSP